MKFKFLILVLFGIILFPLIAFCQGYYPPAQWSEVDTSLLNKNLAGIEANVQKMLEAIDEFDFPDSPIDWATNVPLYETDPIYSAWDKSTGISITESQISDLQAYLTTETDPVYSAWDKDYNDLINTPDWTDTCLTEVNWGDIGGTLSAQTDLQSALDLKANEADLPDTYYTESEIDSLLANKDNWNTAYGWGNHASAGYYKLSDYPNTDTNYLDDFSGSYNDLTDTPELFSGSYNDLTDTPTIPSALSELADDAAHRLVTDTEKEIWNALVSFPGFTDLLTDYDFTDSSADWNTAYGWGDHAGLYSLLAHNHAGVYQPLHANLTSLAGLTYASTSFVKMTAAGTFGLDTNTYYKSGDSPSFGAITGTSFIIGANTITDFSGLKDISGLAKTDSNFIVGNGSAWVAESGATARTSLGLGTGDSPTFTHIYGTGYSSTYYIAALQAPYNTIQSAYPAAGFTGECRWQSIRHRGTIASPTASSVGDVIGNFLFWGYPTTAIQTNFPTSLASEIRYISGTTLYSDLQFHTGLFSEEVPTMFCDVNKNVGIGIAVTSATARLHLPAGTATANTASLKINPGVVATTPVSGNIESDGTHLYWTDSGGTRRQLDN